jgi:diguanylate cyclase (GGDEF)-like protein
VALQATARLLREHQRGADLAVRLGGEEFAMLLPETDLEGAATLAERLRAACDALRLEVPGGALTGMQVTMSIGATGCGAEDRSMDDVLRRADAALYRAKHGGRNRVELA